MNISMYEASAPRFLAMLSNLSALIDKAQAHAAAKKIDEAALTTFRLFPDMLSMTRQVQIACDAAKAAVGRLAAVELPKHADTETTFDELKARIVKASDFIKTIKPEQMAGAEDREIVLTFGPNSLKFTGMEYLLGFALPHFYFHVTTAYDILRHNGIEIGKLDYLGIRL